MGFMAGWQGSRQNSSEVKIAIDKNTYLIFHFIKPSALLSLFSGKYFYKVVDSKNL